MFDAGALRNRLLGEIDSAISRNMSVPGYWYGDPEISQFEQEYIIRRTWQPIGPISSLLNPGDYLTVTVADVPVVIVRAKDDALRGFLNMCRHRGHPVAQDTGNCSVFVCKYHGWSYRADGTLLKAPRSEKETGFDPTPYSLIPVGVGVWGELGFINLNKEAPAFADQFATLIRVADENGIGISNMSYRKTLVWDQTCNWKTFMDNTADCYHCRLVHPNMGTTHKTDPDDYVNDSYDMFAFHISYSRENQANMPSWMACGAWPNWTLQGMQRRVSNVRVLQIMDANHIRVRTDFFAPPSISGDEVEEAADWYHKLVYGEDRPVCEGVARNIIGSRFKEGPILLSSERIMQDFQIKYRQHLQTLKL